MAQKALQVRVEDDCDAFGTRRPGERAEGVRKKVVSAGADAEYQERGDGDQRGFAEWIEWAIMREERKNAAVGLPLSRADHN